MPRDSRLYGWYVTSAGQFEPIMTLDDIAPTNLLRFVSYKRFQIILVDWVNYGYS